MDAPEVEREAVTAEGSAGPAAQPAMSDDAHSPQWWQHRNEARYAQRLCQRTARLYRRLDTAATFTGVLAASAAMSAVVASVPDWLPVTGAVLLAAIGAAHLVVRPADKAASNDADARKYAELLAQAQRLDAVAFAQALAAARASDVPEVEPLRDVAWNDVMLELGRDDLVLPLRLNQRVVAALA